MFSSANEHKSSVHAEGAEEVSFQLQLFQVLTINCSCAVWDTVPLQDLRKTPKPECMVSFKHMNNSICSITFVVKIIQLNWGLISKEMCQKSEGETLTHCNGEKVRPIIAALWTFATCEKLHGTTSNVEHINLWFHSTHINWFCLKI